MSKLVLVFLMFFHVFALAGNEEIVFKYANTKHSYTCKATACFKKDALQKDYDSASKDSEYWCNPTRKGGGDTCKYYESKIQAIKQCSAECGNARCIKQNLTTTSCLVAEFK